MSSVIVSPFSNSTIRDWPADHYAGLIGLLVDRLAQDVRIRVTGTKGQRLGACEIIRHTDPGRVSNDCGILSWPEMVAQIRNAKCVIGNNSGIAHLAGLLGVPTVCVFGGSHQRMEWRPQGLSVTLVSRVIGCSPCHLDHGASCPYEKACLREIEPATVADAVLAAIEQAGPSRSGSAPDAMADQRTARSGA